MIYHYARNVVWGALEADDTVTVTFDIQNAAGDTLFQLQSVHGTLADIQQLIADKVKSKSEALEAYEVLISNTEFTIEMTRG